MKRSLWLVTLHSKSLLGAGGSDAAAAKPRMSATRLALDLVKSKGIFGLYRGIGATALRDISFSVMYFPLFARFDSLVSFFRYNIYLCNSCDEIWIPHGKIFLGSWDKTCWWSETTMKQWCKTSHHFFSKLFSNHALSLTVLASNYNVANSNFSCMRYDGNNREPTVQILFLVNY